MKQRGAFGRKSASEVLIYVLRTFNAASYVIRIAMLHSTYASYVGLARKKERREFALPQEDPSSFSLILRNIIYIISTDIDFTYVRYCVTPT